MASARNVYIYDDVEEMLKKEENISALINKLLRDYFKDKSIKTMTLEQKEQRLAILQIELDAEKKIEALKQNGNN